MGADRDFVILVSDASGAFLDEVALGEAGLVRIGSSKDGNVVLEGPGVAPRHAFLDRIGEGFFVVAEGGEVFLEGKKVASGKLERGARLGIGPFVLRLEEAEAPPNSKLSEVSLSILEEIESVPEPETAPEKKSPPPLVRRRTFEDYFLEELLGKGGFGAVYRAKHLPTGTECALKLIHPTNLKSRDAVSRFLREQELQSSLAHPNIVRFIRAGEAEGLPFLATEFVPGGTLETITPCRDRGQFRRVASGLFSALAYMHERRVVHRDLKPQNVLLGPVEADGIRSAKVADLGFGKTFDGLLNTAVMPSLTQSGTVGGTLRWASPEQLQNFKAFLPSGDLYSAAATLFFLLAGESHLEQKKPLASLNIVEQYQVVTAGKRVSLRSFRTDLPRSITDLLDGLLAQNASAREHSSAASLARFFETV